MFGYVRPAPDRLTEEERLTLRRGAYCGLCHTLGKRYGLAGRMILNYDLTFLAIFAVRRERLNMAHKALSDPSHEGKALRLRWKRLRSGGGYERHSDMVADTGRHRRPWLFQRAEIPGGVTLLRRLSKRARAARPEFDESTQHDICRR